MEGPASDNILVLSADMENLTGLGQQTTNTATVGLNILKY